MNKRLHALTERKAALVKHSEGLLAVIDKGDREFTATESELFDADAAELASIQGQIAEEEAKSSYRTTTTASGMREDVPIDGPGGVVFQNATTGETLRALKPSQPMCMDARLREQPHPVGDALRSWLTGDGSRPGMQASAQMGNVDTDGGFLFEPSLGNYITDLARSASVCQKAGMQTVPMTSNELHLLRVASDPSPMWRPEGVTVTSSGATFDRVVLRSHTLAAIVPLTLELLEDAANASAVIESTVAKAIAGEIDRVCLAGTGAASEPLGVRNHTGVTTDAAVGTPADYSDLTTAVQNILAENYDGDVGSLAWIQNPRDAGTYDGLQDTTDQPLRPTPWAEKLRRYYTTAISITEGTGADSYSVVGDFSQMLLGVRGSGVRFRRIPAGTITDPDGNDWNAVTQLLEHLVAYVRVDVALMRPTWFTLMTGITHA